MRDNDIIESKYVGWAVQSIVTPSFHIIADVTGWETNSDSIMMKKMTVQLVNKNEYGFYTSGTIICAVSVKNNQTLSEVIKWYIYQFNSNEYFVR